MNPYPAYAERLRGFSNMFKIRVNQGSGRSKLSYRILDSVFDEQQRVRIEQISLRGQHTYDLYER